MQCFDRKHERAPHQTVNDQSMPIRIDVGNPGMAALEVQAGRGDDAVEQMQWSASGSHPLSRWIGWRRDETSRFLLESRWLPVSGKPGSGILHPCLNGQWLCSSTCQWCSHRPCRKSAFEEDTTIQDAIMGSPFVRGSCFLATHCCAFTVPRRAAATFCALECVHTSMDSRKKFSGTESGKHADCKRRSSALVGFRHVPGARRAA